jgi:hypothetical protein
MTEFWDLDDLVFGLSGIRDFLSCLLMLVIVFGFAVSIGCSHIHVTGMFAGAAAI